MGAPWRSEKVYRTREEAQPFIDAIAAGGEQFGVYGPWRTYICGSYRRGAELIGDLDILVMTESGHFDDYPFPPSFKPEHMGPQIAQGDVVVMVPGEGKLVSASMHADYYACTREQRGAFLMFLTGPKALNINQRQLAQKRGLSLSQYGLFDQDGKQLDDGTETHIYSLLHIPWLSPTDRQQYADRPKGPGPAWEGKVTSDSRPGLEFTVTIDPDYCGCEAYKYSKELPATCKHIQRKKKELGVRNGSASTATERPSEPASAPVDEDR